MKNIVILITFTFTLNLYAGINIKCIKNSESSYTVAHIIYDAENIYVPIMALGIKQFDNSQECMDGTSYKHPIVIENHERNLQKLVSCIMKEPLFQTLKLFVHQSAQS